LHQFLSGEAYRRSVKAAPGLDPATLNASDRAIWTSAIDPYNDIFKRKMVLDEGLIRVANALAMTEDAARLPESVDTALGANIAAALKAAAPVYRASLRPARQRDSEVWIPSAKSLMQGHETAMKAALEAALHVTWPPEPILVAVVGETGPNLDGGLQVRSRSRTLLPRIRGLSQMPRRRSRPVPDRDGA
jgi:hypothetical protein